MTQPVFSLNFSPAKHPNHQSNFQLHSSQHFPQSLPNFRLPPLYLPPLFPSPSAASLRFSAAMRKHCCDKDFATKGAWSKQEDQKLIDYIQSHGRGCWRSLPTAAGLLRSGKSCRLRWINYLKPGIKRGDFAPDEEDLIIKLHALLGNRWSLIAGRLPGRTYNDVKNYWNSHLRRKLISMGIDPNNHRLNHTLQPPPQPDHSPATTSSSTNQLSDDASSVEDESPHSCDLNLDLSIAFPSNLPKIWEEEKPQIKLLEPMMTANEVGNEPNPALLLFT